MTTESTLAKLAVGQTWRYPDGLAERRIVGFGPAPGDPDELAVRVSHGWWESWEPVELFRRSTLEGDGHCMTPTSLRGKGVSQ